MGGVLFLVRTACRFSLPHLDALTRHPTKVIGLDVRTLDRQDRLSADVAVLRDFGERRSDE